MKNYPHILFAFFVLLLCTYSTTAIAQSTLSVSPTEQTNVVPGVMYIQFKAKHGIDFEHISSTHSGNTEIDQLFQNIGVTEIAPFDADAKKYPVSCRHGIDRMYVINFSNEGFTPDDVANELIKIDAIENVSPRFRFSLAIIPNDPDISQQYALDNMHVKDAWGISEGNAKIIIADVDEGSNYNHEDLAGHIYKIGSNFGYDVIGSGTQQHPKPDNDPMPIDGQSHGTETTGCYGAVPDNGKGCAGTGYNCKIMDIRASDSSAFISGGYEGIHFAVTHGAKIINCSWGLQLDLKQASQKSYFDFVQTYIDEALDTGALVVASSGNQGYNIDDSIFVPADLNGVLSVGATDQNDKPASFSNYGKSVNVYAPGVAVFTTDFPGNSAYAAPQGTSFSSPLTAGVAGLVLAKNPSWPPKFIARQITETVDDVVKPSDRAHYWGRVNALTALTNVTIPGVIISDYKIDGVDKGGLQYLNKVYSIEVVFKNVMASGTGIQVTLIPIDGNVNPNGDGYTVQQSLAPLGSMTAQQQTSGFFKFTRDGTDNGAGSQMPLYFAVSYGSATVQGNKYFDTIPLWINITGDDTYVQKGVEENRSSILNLGNTFPNPVSLDATISFDLAKSGYAALSISDMLGRTISSIADGFYDSGEHTIHFDTKELADGVYIYKLATSDGAVMTKQMIVIH